MFERGRFVHRGGVGTIRTNHVPLLTLCCLSTALLACQDDASDPSSPDAGLDAPPGVLAAEALPETLADLPLSDAIDTWIQLLPEPTARGENVVVHVALPPPLDPALAATLVRVLGEGEAPLLLYRSDALAELGIVPASPGPGYWATFVELDASELERRESIEAQLAASEQPSDTYVEFRGRSPVALRIGVDFSGAAFSGGALAALGPCPVMPASTLARWQESLMITDLAVVQDPTRTWDTCTSSGDPAGVWTFHHLMSELAAGAVPPVSVDEFTTEWLETWLNDQIINGDVVAARPNMFGLVIEPWAAASGVTATLVTTGTSVQVDLSGPLDWAKAPFRLAAIVNRIDLGANDGGGYAGALTAGSQNAGELRFVFGVLDPGCAPLPFSVIFEYGVPRQDCEDIRDWAVAWTELNDPSLLPPFDPAWLAQLEVMTESVVKFGAAPSKGNDNALNQMRTNENALDGQWEMREFTLTVESTATLPNDTPADGFLRPHSVAMTPNDSTFSAAGDPMIDLFVGSEVVPAVGSPTTLPADCRSSHVVPLEYLGQDFRGGNAFVGPVNFWESSPTGGGLAQLCARHEFSLETCSGCHFDDTTTFFLHVDPQTIPASLSNFLTGGTSGIHSVVEPQTPSVVTWTFADLERRYHRLYEIACAPCASSVSTADGAIARMLDIAGVVPIDRAPLAGDPPIGPITKLSEVAAIWAGEQLPGQTSESVEIGGFIRPAQTFVH
jgi:hypothetical protein